MLDGERERLVRTISILSNLLVLSNFLMFRFAGGYNRWSPVAMIVSWIVFIMVLVLANVWIYFSFYKKRTGRSERRGEVAND